MNLLNQPIIAASTDSIASSDPESFEDYLRIFSSFEFQKIMLPLALTYIIVWTFLVKLGLVNDEKRINKAKEEFRTIKATFDDIYLFTDNYNEGNRYYRYAYTNPITGKKKHYTYEYRDAAPDDEVELYYDKNGKVFGPKTERRRATFWIWFGLIVPLVLTKLFQNYI